MDNLRELGRGLMLLGGLLFLVGVLLFSGWKLPFRLGGLPGDIAYKGENTTVYFPIATCVLLSIGLSLILWIISRFRQ